MGKISKWKNVKLKKKKQQQQQNLTFAKQKIRALTLFIKIKTFPHACWNLKCWDIWSASHPVSHKMFSNSCLTYDQIFWSILCIRQRKPWTPPPQGSTQIWRRGDVESWGVYFQGLGNLDLINFLTMWIFTLCEFRPGESWMNAIYISSENVLNIKIDCSKNVLLIVVLVEYKLKWMCC